MTLIAQKNIAEIVTDNYKAAEVMEKYGLDFCCKGKVPLEVACQEKQVNLDSVLSDLEKLDQKKDKAFNFNEWKLSLLVDYINHNHHDYVRKSIPRLRAHTQKVAMRHGEHNPALLQIADLFDAVSQELLYHMQKEEKMLFPYIKRLEEATDRGLEAPGAAFGTVENPIRLMLNEHETAGELLAQIRELTNNYTPPANACNTYRITFAELEEFEHDLHQHVHLENNILFPRSIALEKELSSKA